MNKNVAIIIHDSHDSTVDNLLNKFIWGNIAASNSINHVYKVGGEQKGGFVPYGPEHKIPSKKVCVMAPGEAQAAGVNAIELNDYNHEEECTYIFGTDDENRGWHEQFVSEETDYVTIEMPKNTELYTFSAATLVLWDRWRKMNGGN